MHPSLSRLSVLPHIECLRLDRSLTIVHASDGCARFGEASGALSLGRPVFDGLPELFGLEDLIASIADGEMPSFELKAISRPQPDDRPLYFDIYIVPDEPAIASDDAQSAPADGPFALLFLEDVTNTMSLEQTLVQSSNEMSLLLDKLSASEKYVRQLVASIGDILLVTDANGVLQRTNYRFTEVLGIPGETAIGRLVTDFIDASHFDPAAIQKYLTEAEGKILRNIETYARHRNGSRIVLSFSCSLLRSPEGDGPVEFIYLGRDITANHYARQRLVTQSSISRTLAEADTLQSALPRLLAGMGMGLDWDIVEFWQPRSTWMSAQSVMEDMLCCEDAWVRPGIEAAAWSAERYTQPIEGQASWIGRVWKQQRPIWVSGVGTNLQFVHRARAREISLNTAFVSPLEVDGEPVGVLALFCQDVRARDPDMVQIVETLSSQIGQFVRRKRAETALRHEQQRTESLLCNILPEKIAQRLKRETSTIADYYSDVTVLFADIVGFTRMSSQIEPHELVRRLNQIFSAFDELSETHGLEKIKTIGDAYMVVGGLPSPRDDHASAIAAMALDMQDAIALFNEDRDTAIGIRIGIHSGPVIAGVIGIKKFIYDLWGDTVNIASRLESHGVPDRIQISEATRDRLDDTFTYCERGEIDLKGRGKMRTFFLLEKREEPMPSEADVDPASLTSPVPTNDNIIESIARKLRDR